MIETTSDTPATWDAVADLVVVGTGAAALTAAIVGTVEGLSVIALEKSALVGGTTSVSGGGIWVPLNHHMADVGVPDSREEALEYLRACAGDAGDDDLLVALVDHGAPMVRYLEERAGLRFRAWPSQGPTLDYRPWLPGAKHGGRPLDPGRFRVADLGEWGPKVRRGGQSEWVMDRLEYYTKRMFALPPADAAPRPYRPEAPDAVPEYFAAGSALVGQLLKACIELGVGIETERPARRLVVDGGRVIGVAAERDGSPYFVRATRAVVLGTGGYGTNEELKRLWLNRPLLNTCDIPENQGDGHLMGMAVGAQVANLGDAWWMPMGSVEAADGTVVNIAGVREDRILPHTLMVNQRGKRFTNEAQNYYDICEAFGLKSGGTPRNHPAHLIFDQQAAGKYAALARTAAAPDEPGNGLTVAGSIEELAGKLEIDPGSLHETIERFNGFAREGRDRDFARGENPWDAAWGDPDHRPNPSLGTVEKPPFFAVRLMPAALATKGGLRVNADGQVLSAALPFDPIPGLYAAGNCSNAGVAGAYPGPGATLGPAMTFGYIAARSVARGAELAPAARAVAGA